jgi:signal transduction histidine kinase
MDTAAVRTETPVPTAAVVPLLARSPWGTAVATLAVLAALTATAVLTAGDGWGSAPSQQVVVDLAVGLTYPPIGAVVLLAHGLGRGTRQLAWVLLGSGTAAALTALAAAMVVVAPEATAAVGVLAQLQSWLWVPGFVPLLTLVPLLYPDGLLPGRLWRWVAAASTAGIVLMVAGVALYPEVVDGRVPVTKPLTSLAVARVFYVGAVALLVPSALLSVASLFVRLRASTGLRRRQVVVLLVAAALLLLVTAAQGLIPTPVNTLVQAVAVALVPAAIGVAVTRHRLYELDVAICRALVATSLAICLAGTYLTVFALARAVAPGGSAVGTAVAAGVTGVLVQPLARRLSSGVERLYYGDRADPYAVSARLASRLAARGLDVAEVPQAVCDTVVESLRLGSAEIRLAGSHQVVGAATRHHTATGVAGRGTAQFPLRHRGEEVGTLLVTARPGEGVVGLRDAEVLATVADQAAPAIAALGLHQQLQHSRESLVLAREEERLRLRRDLHDGLGATLAGLRLQVESAQALVGDTPAASLLAAAGRGVTSAVAEVRGITDSLRPPALDEIGLARALELLAERVRTPGLEVSAHVSPQVSSQVTPQASAPAGAVVPLGAAAEVAAYRIASEALANVARHSGATTSVLSLSVEPAPDGQGPQVVLEVADNGRGLPASGAAPTSGSGLGLAAMRQRAEEIGGSFEVTSPADLTRVGLTGVGGTLVRAVLPLHHHLDHHLDHHPLDEETA